MMFESSGQGGMTERNLELLGKVNQKKERDKKTLIDEWTWAFPDNRAKLDDEKFVLISFQHYYEKMGRSEHSFADYVPAEMAIIEFTLGQGIISKEHFIFSLHANKMSDKERDECVEQFDNVHGLWETIPTKKYHITYIQAYNKLRSIVGKHPHVYCLVRELLDVPACINHLGIALDKRPIFTKRHEQLIWLETLIKTAVNWKKGGEGATEGLNSVPEDMDIVNTLPERVVGELRDNMCGQHKAILEADPHSSICCSLAFAATAVNLVCRWYKEGKIECEFELGKKKKKKHRDKGEKGRPRMPEWDFERPLVEEGENTQPLVEERGNTQEDRWESISAADRSSEDAIVLMDSDTETLKKETEGEKNVHVSSETTLTEDDRHSPELADIVVEAEERRRKEREESKDKLSDDNNEDLVDLIGGAKGIKRDKWGRGHYGLGYGWNTGEEKNKEWGGRDRGGFDRVQSNRRFGHLIVPQSEHPQHKLEPRGGEASTEKSGGDLGQGLPLAKKLPNSVPIPEVNYHGAQKTEESTPRRMEKTQGAVGKTDGNTSRDESVGSVVTERERSRAAGGSDWPQTLVHSRDAQQHQARVGLRGIGRGLRPQVWTEIEKQLRDGYQPKLSHTCT